MKTLKFIENSFLKYKLETYYYIYQEILIEACEQGIMYYRI